jgi:hypothetical protein
VQIFLICSFEIIFSFIEYYAGGSKVTCNFEYSTSVNCVACQSSQRKRERERKKETTDF